MHEEDKRLKMRKITVKGMFKKHRKDCEHQKNAQFDIYAITSNFFNKFQRNFAKKLIIM